MSTPSEGLVFAAPAPGDLVLTVRQPWAWLIIHGGKDVENRTWPTRVRGRIWIHSAASMTRDEGISAQAFVYGLDPDLCGRMSGVPLAMGGVIGSVEIIDCVEASDSAWFEGPFGFVLREPRPVTPIRARGALGFWRWQPNAALLPSSGSRTI